MQIWQILAALASSVIISAIFTFLKLPLPAPNARADIAGISGILLGSILVNYFLKK